ncbi:sodium:calcium antiporter [Alicyclobacillus tolerans]|uniref:sodium:calcium antiporter n=1 Tax=Alicyclobacillus tolerans TaxID=90970 RepID=UPI003B81E322
MTAVTTLFALAMILFGAELFTNAIEWLGVKLQLGQGAVGSVLAAIGTALPETAVPVTAILFGTSKEAADVGIGGILGAPFLLSTLGSLVMALALLSSRNRTIRLPLSIEQKSFMRDMGFFICAYICAMVAGCVPIVWVHHLSALLLVFLYALFVWRTLRDKPIASEEEPDLHALYLSFSKDEPKLSHIVLQVFLSIACIVGGAHFLTNAVEHMASVWRLPAFVVSALLIPLATELPETLNSVMWIRRSRDSLAVGNITGAMVFQSTWVPALGIWMTPWSLTTDALLTGSLTLAAAAFLYGMYRLYGGLYAWMLWIASIFYFVMPLLSIPVVRHSPHWFFIFVFIIIFLLFLAYVSFRRSTNQEIV